MSEHWNDILHARMGDAFTRAFDSAELLAGVAEATATPRQEFYKNSIAMTISEDMAVAYGLIPDQRPADVIAAERERWKREREVAAAETAAYVEALSTVTDPLSVALLALHARGAEDSWSRNQCQGCDFDGYEGEPPGWPCRTVEAVSEHNGIEVPRRIEFDAGVSS